MDQKLALLVLKGMITELPQEQQDKIKECVEKLTITIKDYGDVGQMAIAIIGATIALEGEG